MGGKITGRKATANGVGGTQDVEAIGNRDRLDSLFDLAF